MFPPWAPFFNASLRWLHGGNQFPPWAPFSFVCSRPAVSLLSPNTFGSATRAWGAGVVSFRAPKYI
jgi:hypothetical protein